MKKDYLKPEAEWISLVANEAVTTGDNLLNGEMGSESSDF